MKIVVFSDVHGNLPAFELMLRHAGKADQYICLGDMVNYGPWSEECVQLVSSLSNCIFLLGNHETYFLKGEYNGKHPLPKKFFDICFPDFQSFDRIRALPESHQAGEFCFVHTLEDRNIYPDSFVDLSENTFIGHSHHQFYREFNGFRLYNVGSVGQNRQYMDVICYAIFYPETGRIDLRQFSYNVDILLAEMKHRRYPEECIAYYQNKKRKSVPVKNNK